MDGAARIFFNYMETLNHAIYHGWLHFSQHPLPERENHLDVARIEPKLPRYPLLNASRALKEKYEYENLELWLNTNICI